MHAAIGHQYALNRFVAASDALHYLTEHGISYLAVRPMQAQAFALEALRQGIMPRLDAIFTYGTGARPDERTDCLRAFGAQMIVPYSAKEGQLIAFPCQVGTHYHVNEENVLVEIVDAENRPCGIGQPGRVIVTPLHNFAQPLIRYEQGDMAVWGEPCKCGRSLRVIERIVGRQEHLFRFPDGSRVALAVPFELQPVLGARYWQIAQTAPLVIEVRYVPLGPVGDEAPIADIIRRNTHPDVTVTFRRVQEIPRTEAGKFLPYVYEVSAT
jgi:phenylacetate-CoA ligase